ncbi:hypothetical protein GCM10029992_25500 [Glycomyces albus]
MRTAVSYIGTHRGPRLVAFFATMYYAMLRPSEAIDLRAAQCHLPDTGWGTITLETAAPAAGRRYTDTGRTHDPRGLKHRNPGTTRTIPIPPRLVQLLRTHLKTYGTAPDGRLFQTHTGHRLDPSTYDLVWHQARDYGLPAADRDTPRLHRPYDLRHSGISLRRTADIPTNQVAAWAGNSEQTIDRIYSKTLEGYDTRWQTQIDTILNHQEHDPTDPETDIEQPLLRCLRFLGQGAH